MFSFCILFLHNIANMFYPGLLESRNPYSDFSDNQSFIKNDNLDQHHHYYHQSHQSLALAAAVHHSAAAVAASSVNQHYRPQQHNAAGIESSNLSLMTDEKIVSKNSSLMMATSGTIPQSLSSFSLTNFFHPPPSQPATPSAHPIVSYNSAPQQSLSVFNGEQMTSSKMLMSAYGSTITAPNNHPIGPANEFSMARERSSAAMNFEPYGLKSQLLSVPAPTSVRPIPLYGSQFHKNSAIPPHAQQSQHSSSSLVNYEAAYNEMTHNTTMGSYNASFLNSSANNGHCAIKSTSQSLPSRHVFPKSSTTNTAATLSLSETLSKPNNYVINTKSVLANSKSTPPVASCSSSPSTSSSAGSSSMFLSLASANETVITHNNEQNSFSDHLKRLQESLQAQKAMDCDEDYYQSKEKTFISPKSAFTLTYPKPIRDHQQDSNRNRHSTESTEMDRSMGLNFTDNVSPKMNVKNQPKKGIKNNFNSDKGKRKKNKNDLSPSVRMAMEKISKQSSSSSSSSESKRKSVWNPLDEMNRGHASNTSSSFEKRLEQPFHNEMLPEMIERSQTMSLSSSISANGIEQNDRNDFRNHYPIPSSSPEKNNLSSRKSSNHDHSEKNLNDCKVVDTKSRCSKTDKSNRLPINQDQSLEKEIVVDSSKRFHKNINHSQTSKEKESSPKKRKFETDKKIKAKKHTNNVRRRRFRSGLDMIRSSKRKYSKNKSSKTASVKVKNSTTSHKEQSEVRKKKSDEKDIRFESRRMIVTNLWVKPFYIDLPKTINWLVLKMLYLEN
ncbi:hypothetical protein SSS_08081 [Sarcoptes scabiei]|uniref:Uncharacterized protein n=1 Tax=Sarcoptes scabiei TaxID=52283 RepID=A0A834R848_SARSC|nr:hypothetical protein SSS_08081 [Sarcoptes scabiei]